MECSKLAYFICFEYSVKKLNIYRSESLDR